MYEHMQIVDEDRNGNPPEGYRWAFAGESENWENIPEAIQVRRYVDSNGVYYDEDESITDIAVPVDRAPVEDCIPEFDDHDKHDDCARMLVDMAGYPMPDPSYDIEYQNYMYGSSRY